MIRLTSKFRNNNVNLFGRHFSANNGELSGTKIPSILTNNPGYKTLSITTDADTTGQFDWKEIKGKLSDNQLDIVSFFTCDELIVHGGWVYFFLERGLMIDEFRSSLQRIGAIDSWKTVTQAVQLLEQPNYWKLFVELHKKNDDPNAKEREEEIIAQLTEIFAPYLKSYLESRVHAENLFSELIKKNRDSLITLVE